jgi:SAM-dependent methyltransferase
MALHEWSRLGGQAWWWKLHWGLWRAYRGWHPHRALGSLPEAERQDSLAYGETPAYTVLRALGLCRRHYPEARSLLDLGAGRGTLALTAAANGWNVVAIECLEDLVARSQPVSAALGWPVRWVQGDLLTLPHPRFDILHVAATAFPDAMRQTLANRLAEECDSGQGLLLQDWILDDDRFEPLAGVRLPVTWGTSYFTLHRPRLRGPGTFAPPGQPPDRWRSTRSKGTLR